MPLQRHQVPVTPAHGVDPLGAGDLKGGAQGAVPRGSPLGGAGVTSPTPAGRRAVGRTAAPGAVPVLSAVPRPDPTPAAVYSGHRREVGGRRVGEDEEAARDGDVSEPRGELEPGLEAARHGQTVVQLLDLPPGQVRKHPAVRPGTHAPRRRLKLVARRYLPRFHVNQFDVGAERACDAQDLPALPGQREERPQSPAVVTRHGPRLLPQHSSAIYL